MIEPDAPLPARVIVGRIVRILMASAFGFVVAFYVIIFLVQRRMMYFPRPYQVSGSPFNLLPPGASGIAYNCEGVEQYTFWVPGRDATNESPIYFVLGGNATKALDWVDWVVQVQKQQPAVSFCLIEYPGYGMNGGRPTRETIHESALAAREALRAHLKLDDAALRARTRILGHSIGAAAGLEIAQEIGARQIVLFAPFTTALAEATHAVGWWLSWMLRDRYDNVARLDELAARKDRPEVFMFHGSADEVIPVEMGREIAKKYEGWIVYKEAADIRHNDIIDVMQSDFIKLAGPGKE